MNSKKSMHVQGWKLVPGRERQVRDMFYFRLGSVLEMRQERVGAEWGKCSHTAGAWKLAYEAQAA